jgi:hypothetical protein
LFMKMQTKAAFAATALTLCVGSALAGSDGATGDVAQNSVRPAQSASARQPSAAALARAQERLQNAQQVVHQFAAQAQAQHLPETWRAELLNHLMVTSDAAIATVQGASDVHAALQMASQAAFSEQSHAKVAAKVAVKLALAPNQPDALGNPTSDLTYIPLTPCRIVDTRQAGAGGPLAAGATRVFDFQGSAAQGDTTGCDPYSGYPQGAYPAALAVNVTVDPRNYLGSPGAYINVFPDGSSPTTSWLNFNSQQVVANAGVITINQSNGWFDVYVQTETNVIVDVFGAFVMPQATALSCYETAATTVSIGANSWGGLVSAACPYNTGTGGGCYTTNFLMVMSYSVPSGNAWNCGWYNMTGSAQTGSAYATCCAVPGG